MAKRGVVLRRCLWVTCALGDVAGLIVTPALRPHDIRGRCSSLLSVVATGAATKTPGVKKAHSPGLIGKSKLDEFWLVA